MWKGASLVMLGTLVGLVLCEGVVRIAGIAPEVALISIGRFRYSANPDIGYEPVPGYAYEGNDLRYYEFRGVSNSLGFRDREHPVERVEGRSRILVLGDSVTMGLYVPDDEDVFTRVLEDDLRRAGRDVEVLNFGVSGYNTRQEVATLIEKGLRYEPDLVILQYSLNDTRMVNGGIIDRLREREEESGEPDRTLASPFLMKSALYRFVRFRIGDLGVQRRQRSDGLARLGRNTVNESFDLLRRTAEEHGFEVLVVVFPDFGNYTDELSRMHLWVAELSASNGFRHLDLSSDLTACAQVHGRSIAIGSMHPSATGHRCAGTAIARYLLNGDVVKGSLSSGRVRSSLQEISGGLAIAGVLGSRRPPVPPIRTPSTDLTAAGPKEDTAF